MHQSINLKRAHVDSFMTLYIYRETVCKVNSWRDKVCRWAAGSEVILSCSVIRYKKLSAWTNKCIQPIEVIFKNLDRQQFVINQCNQISGCAALSVQSELLIELCWCVIVNNTTPCNTPHLLLLHTPFSRVGTNEHRCKKRPYHDIFHG